MYSGYRGTISKTISGKTCQKWTENSPHAHNYTEDNYPNNGIGDHNYCRNPDEHARKFKAVSVFTYLGCGINISARIVVSGAQPSRVRLDPC